MYAHMVKEPKAQRTYFRVPDSFKHEFFAAALVNGQDPSEAFRYIGRQFIDRVKREKPEDFSGKLEEIQAEAAAAQNGPTTKEVKLTKSTPRRKKTTSKQEKSGHK